jgi:GNAT superfamily N-acetyltransferase
MADDAIHGIGVRIGGALIGIAHYLYHANIWGPGSCYLQDLYVDEVARGQGAATALIERVAQDAQKVGLTRLYWHTKQDNARARRLYEEVACFRGFIVYDQSLSRAPLPTGCR